MLDTGGDYHEVFKCGIDFNPDKIIMMLEDDAEPVCDLCAVKESK